MVRMVIGSKYPLGGPQDCQRPHLARHGARVSGSLPLPSYGVQPHGLYLKGCNRASPRPWVWGAREEGESWV